MSESIYIRLLIIPRIIFVIMLMGAVIHTVYQNFETIPFVKSIPNMVIIHMPNGTWQQRQFIEIGKACEKTADTIVVSLLSVSISSTLLQFGASILGCYGAIMNRIECLNCYISFNIIALAFFIFHTIRMPDRILFFYIAFDCIEILLAIILIIGIGRQRMLNENDSGTRTRSRSREIETHFQEITIE